MKLQELEWLRATRPNAQGERVKIGPRGVELIQSYEKLRLRAYLPTSEDRLTIGWGHTGDDVEADTVWTREEADSAFLKDIAWVEECVNKAVTMQLTQNEFDALCSLCFNIGCSAFGRSTLVKLLNSGDFDAASKEFTKWDRQGDKILSGLVARRAAEQRLFETMIT